MLNKSVAIPAYLSLTLPLFFALVVLVVPTAMGKTYKWLDKKGVTHISDSPAEIPPEYQDQIKEKPKKSAVERSAERGNIEAQFFLINIKAAENGDSSAQFKVATAYQNGKGVSKDTDEAVKWYILAASNGHPMACRSLGDLYYSGDGISKDIVQAFDWYLKAAEQGDIYAQGRLAAMYYKAEGSREKAAKAIKWVRASAERGLADDQYILGDMYERGMGVIPDGAEADKWYLKAANQGHTLAKQTIEYKRQYAIRQSVKSTAPKQ